MSLRSLGMLDPRDPAKIGMVVRDLYKTFAAPTRAAADPVAEAYLDAAQRSAAAAAAALLNAGRDGGGTRLGRLCATRLCATRRRVAAFRRGAGGPRLSRRTRRCTTPSRLMIWFVDVLYRGWARMIVCGPGARPRRRGHGVAGPAARPRRRAPRVACARVPPQRSGGPWRSSRGMHASRSWRGLRLAVCLKSPVPSAARSAGPMSCPTRRAPSRTQPVRDRRTRCSRPTRPSSARPRPCSRSASTAGSPGATTSSRRRVTWRVWACESSRGCAQRRSSRGTTAAAAATIAGTTIARGGAARRVRRAAGATTSVYRTTTSAKRWMSVGRSKSGATRMLSTRRLASSRSRGGSMRSTTARDAIDTWVSCPAACV